MRPEDVAGREFSVSRRGGYDADEVRAFLQGVAARLEEQERRIRALEEQLHEALRPDRRRLVRLLGEEVATILEEADAVRHRAYEQVQSLQARIEDFLEQMGDVQRVMGDLIEGVRKETSALLEEAATLRPGAVESHEETTA